MANRTKFTPQKRGKFLTRLRKTANVTKSAIYAGMSRRALYDRRDSDEDFAAEWNGAVEEAVELLEEEARHRAQDGVLEPVFYQGKKVGRVRKYSDTLLIFLLKAHKPEKYRERSEVKHTGDALQVTINVREPSISNEVEEDPGQDVS